MRIKEFQVGFGISMMATMCMALGFVLTLIYAVDPLKKEAVERGYAEWVTDTSGRTTWQWKEAE